MSESSGQTARARWPGGFMSFSPLITSNLITMPLETDRLLLRPFTLDDAAEYHPLVSDPAVLRYTGESPIATLDEVRARLEAHPLRDYRVHGFGRMACIEKATGRLIGFSGLKYLEDLKEVDVGYRFITDAWGKGYATESARALMQHDIARHGLKRIIGLVESTNTASVHVLQKLGLQYEGPHRAHDDSAEWDLYGVRVDVETTAAE